MKYVLYVSAMVSLGLYADALHASETQDCRQLVLIVGKSKDPFDRTDGRLELCSFVVSNESGSDSTSMMQIERDVAYPVFRVLPKERSSYFLIDTDEEGITHVHEKTAEIESLKKELIKVQKRKEERKKAYKKIEKELDKLRKKRIQQSETAQKIAVGLGVCASGIALCSLCYSWAKTTPVCCD